MRIAVLIKQVPDSKLIEIDENGNLRRDGVPSMVDPFGFFALRFAVGMKEALEGTVTAVTMGPSQASEALRRCLQYGADDAVLLCDRAFAGSDTYATSNVLAHFLSQDYDYILCGMQATDGDTGQVPAELSVMLNYELISYASGFETGDDGIAVTQRYDGYVRRVLAHRHSVISVCSEIPHSRPFPSITDYLESEGRPITVEDRISLNLGAYSAGMKGSHTKVVHTSSPMPVKKDRIIIDGTDPAAAAEALLKEVRG